MTDLAFPIFFKLGDKPVLIVGGGELALRKARILADAGAVLHVVDANPSPELAALAAQVEHRAFHPGDVEGASLVFAAVEDEALAASVSEAAQEAGVPVNAVDRSHLSTFIMGAVIDRAPVFIAIGSQGASPVIVRRIRAQIEALLNPQIGRFARFLDSFRGTVARLMGDAPSRRLFWERAVDGQVAQAFYAGDEAKARSTLISALNGGPTPESGGVALVGAGPGDPDLLTLKAHRLLGDADVVVYDKLVDDRVLGYARRDAAFIYVGKSKANHSLSQDEINALLVRHAKAGQRVVRLKGGDPFIFGRGGEEAAACRAADVSVEIVPGITAALGCASAAGIPLTHRSVAQGLSIITGHGEHGEPDVDWAALAALNHTVAIYMGLSTAGRSAQQLIAAGVPPETPVSVIEKGTRPDQQTLFATLETLEATVRHHGLEGPAMIVVGDVVKQAHAYPRAPMAYQALDRLALSA
jgi:uroporphyrin-III C-methyltransferase / precorrin-2 dehydrogenase / sirohydrochlorin ferrochelatase